MAQRQGLAPLDRYLEHRRITSGMHGYGRISDVAHGIYVRDQILNSIAIKEIRTLVNDHTALANDLYGSERDWARHDRLNAIFVIEHEYQCGRDEAIVMLVEILDQIMRYYLQLEESLPRTCRDLGVTEPGELEVIDRMVQSHHTWIRGNLDWHRNKGETCRVKERTPPEGFVPASEVKRVAVLDSTQPTTR
jgi:hypothetical protein